MSLEPLTPVQGARRLRHLRRYRRPGIYLALALVAAFALLPLGRPSFQLLDLAAKIALFAALVASYDVVLGYTGIVSFGHAMFFGFGAYGVALALGKFGLPTYGNLGLGLLAGVAVSAVVAFLIAAFSLRVKAIFFAMITLAFAEFATILSIQWSQLTGGEDGITPKVPGVFAASFTLRVLGVPLTGRAVTYWTIVAVVTLAFLLMARFVDSPLGRVLQAIRDNEMRAEALGFRPFVFQSVASVFAAAIAAVTGAGYALWVGFVNPESTLGLQIMLDVLLMVIIGGIGTLYGGIIGAAFIVTARTLLPDLRGVAAALAPGSDLLARMTDRWLLYFGILFILVVFFFPKGVVGTLRQAIARRAAR